MWNTSSRGKLAWWMLSPAAITFAGEADVVAAGAFAEGGGEEEGYLYWEATVPGPIEQHNGTIDVDSKLGRGTTFQILFPVTI